MMQDEPGGWAEAALAEAHRAVLAARRDEAEARRRAAADRAAAAEALARSATAIAVARARTEAADAAGAQAERTGLEARQRVAAAERRAMEAEAVRDTVLRSTMWRALAPARRLLGAVRPAAHPAPASAPVPVATPAPPPVAEVPPPPALSDPLPPAPPPPVPGWPGTDEKAAVTAQALAELDVFLHSGQRIAFPPAPMPAVSVVVVLWNAAELTLRCLRGLQAQGIAGLELVLVDNGSADATGALLSRIDGATVLRHPDNAGFVAGCNRGVAASRGRAVLLLNSDAVPRPGTVRAALETLDGPEVGAVGARLILSDGTLQEAGSIVWADGTTAGIGRGQPAEWSGAMARRDVDYCSGAFLLLRRAVWDALGGLDERFSPAYYEEADLCLRLRACGLRVAYEPRAAVDHFEFGSSGAGGEAARVLQIRNRKLFRALHADALQARLPRAAGNVPAARARLRPGQRRLLIIDDLPPLAVTGAGYPRARAVAAAALGLGWAVTLFCTVPSGTPVDWDALRAEVPWEIEVVTGPGSPGLLAFLQERAGLDEVMLVSRPGNMAAVRAVAAGHPHLLWGVRLVYDAEALFTRREVLQAVLAGAPLAPEEAAARLERELSLADAADAVACVSPAEAAAFAGRVAAPVRVLGYPGTVRTDAPGFAERSGLLFVGTLGIQASPNWDGMAWFVRDVWPGLRARLPDLTLCIAGQVHPDAAALDGPGITRIGPQADLAPVYDRARVFVSPVRYAAGIPLKMIDATFAGLPCAGTALMARLMDWQPGTHTMAADDPAELADGIATLHGDAALWTRIRDAAAADAGRFAPGAFRDTLAALLG